MNFMNILAIFIGGASYALAGFLKNYVRGEKFNPSKISKTLLIAGIMSIINSLLGLDSWLSDLLSSIAIGKPKFFNIFLTSSLLIAGSICGGVA